MLRGLVEILDLWRDGRYDDLYGRTSGGSDGKESFSRRLSGSPRRPACCWEKLQEAQVSLKDGHKAVVHARFGFEESLPGTRFVTRGISLKKEHGVWTVSRSDLLSLAAYSKKRRSYIYLPAPSPGSAPHQ